MRVTPRSVHLCVDMQRLFSADGPWPTPWMHRVLPQVVRLSEHRPERTIFTRFVPPERPEDARGTWSTYFLLLRRTGFHFGGKSLSAQVDGSKGRSGRSRSAISEPSTSSPSEAAKG